MEESPTFFDPTLFLLFDFDPYLFLDDKTRK